MKVPRYKIETSSGLIFGILSDDKKSFKKTKFTKTDIKKFPKSIKKYIEENNFEIEEIENA